MRGKDPGNFYEEDEPVKKIISEFEHGEKVFTSLPPRGYNETLDIPGLNPGPILTASPNRPLGHVTSNG